MDDKERKRLLELARTVPEARDEVMRQLHDDPRRYSVTVTFHIEDPVLEFGDTFAYDGSGSGSARMASGLASMIIDDLATAAPGWFTLREGASWRVEKLSWRDPTQVVDAKLDIADDWKPTTPAALPDRADAVAHALADHEVSAIWSVESKYITELSDVGLLMVHSDAGRTLDDSDSDTTFWCDTCDKEVPTPPAGTFDYV